MKNRVRISILAISLFIPACSYAEPFQPYTVQPDDFFSLVDIDGQTRSIADFAGKVVVVNFWASWCGPCVEEMPELTRLKKEMTGKPLEVVAINVGESRNRVNQFIRSLHFELPVLLDSGSQSFNGWGVELLPTSYLIDATGKIRFRARGNPGWDQQPTYDTIEALIAETVK
jgi:thiol-disulfide isomerase/thioredoxin